MYFHFLFRTQKQSQAMNALVLDFINKTTLSYMKAKIKYLATTINDRQDFDNFNLNFSIQTQDV